MFPDGRGNEEAEEPEEVSFVYLFFQQNLL